MAGFEMVQKIDAGEHHYGIIWRKSDNFTGSYILLLCFKI